MVFELLSFLFPNKRNIHNFAHLIKIFKNMKKLVLLIGILVMTMGLAKAQEEKKVNNGPEIEFEQLNYDFGNVEYGGTCEVEFRFTNTGNEPLIIQKPKTSCGCTASSWPKEPILPGASESIKVTYKTTTKVGNFSKSVTVTSNAVVNNTVILRIKGAILPQPTEALPEKDFGNGSPVNNN